MLENKLGITDLAELARIEEKISKQKAVEMFESGYLESLEAGTYESLAMIHKYLFDEIYDFKSFQITAISNALIFGA